MTIEMILAVLTLFLAAATLTVLLRNKPAAELTIALEAQLGPLRSELERIERSLRDDHRAARSELQETLHGFETRLGAFTERTESGLNALRKNLADDARASREEAGKGLDRFALAMTERLDKLGEITERRLGEVRSTLEARLLALQTENAGKLDQMRQTVDEKLQSTLQTRLDESFKQVSERLEQVHRGLGEMQSLATGVGDLKRVLGNVKSRGIFGEVQLAAILEQMLTPDQYAANVATVPNASERVEYAIRLPGAKDDPDSQVWLPIDAKFPRKDYEDLLMAQEAGDAEAALAASSALERQVRFEAKKIADKYVSPPFTTDFAILFLPTEGLYAEVLRRPGLVESLQSQQRIVIAGPTTLSAILNSLRMGFKTLAIEQRSSEVWQVLGAIKTEFGSFSTLLQATKKQLQTVTNSIDKGFVRSRAIEKKLRGVEAVSSDESQRLLGQSFDFASSDADAENDDGAD